MYTQRHVDITKLYGKPDDWIDKIITVCGWVQFSRSSGGKGKNIHFIRLSDGTCAETLQIIYDSKSLPQDKLDYFDDLFKRAKTGMSLTTTGLIVKSPAKGQPIEMQAHKYKIFGDVMDPETYPMAKGEQSLEFMRTIQHLRIRSDTFKCVNRIKSVMKLAVGEYFDKLGFVEVQIPLITDNECESGANPFTVTTLMSDSIQKVPVQGDKIDYSQDFFKKRCYLTVSAQLHLECLILGGFQKAYCLTTAFRAEPSLSPLHAGEFWMLELEFCFGTIQDNIQVNEGCIKHCVQKVLEKCHRDLEFLQQKYKPGLIETLKRYVAVPFIVTTHEECIGKMLDDIKSGKAKINPNKKPEDGLMVFKEIPEFDGDLSKDHEKYITQVLYDHIPVFVQMYPAAIKSFYMPKINKGAAIERVDNFDMLMPEIGEVVGGSQRETDYDELKSRMLESGINPETLQFYLDLRKYGTTPHTGSGIGIDRLLLAVTGLTNIRDMIPFPRAYELCQF
jgi:asparaginyl-tRNA synthetase